MKRIALALFLGMFSVSWAAETVSEEKHGLVFFFAAHQRMQGGQVPQPAPRAAE